jgi:transcriptional regulator with XRE-family HTH domain
MADQISPAVRQHRLARRLRALRDQAGLSIEEAARRLDKTRSTLGRIEQGKTRADVHLVRSMMDVYDVWDETLIDLARESAKKGWWHSRKQDGHGYIRWETEASEILNHELLFIPGLLQTESYMRALFSLRAHEQRLELDVADRLFRQRRLTDRDAPLRLSAILDESALHWPIGGPDVMRAQLSNLMERSRLDTVTLQVMPRGPKPYGGMAGAFTVLRFPVDEDPDRLFISHPFGAINIEDRGGVEEVKAARHLFDQLRSQALSPGDSVELIERVAREL